MDNEENLASPNLLPSVTGVAATVAMGQAAKTMTGWQRKLMYVFMAITLLAAAAGIIGGPYAVVARNFGEVVHDPLPSLEATQVIVRELQHEQVLENVSIDHSLLS